MIKVRRYGQPLGGSTFAVLRGDEELGRYYETKAGWVVLMPDGSGRCRVRMPDTYPTATAAKDAIVEAHNPEKDP